MVPTSTKQQNGVRPRRTGSHRRQQQQNTSSSSWRAESGCGQSWGCSTAAPSSLALSSGRVFSSVRRVSSSTRAVPCCPSCCGHSAASSPCWAPSAMPNLAHAFQKVGATMCTYRRCSNGLLVKAPKPFKAFGPLPAFLFLWISLLIVNPTSNAVIALTFAQYVLKPLFPYCSTPEAPVRLVAGCVIG